MKRGSIVLAQLNAPYAEKARPCVVVQSNEISKDFLSVTVCPITTTEKEDTSYFRIPVLPTKTNKLKKKSFIMIDKIASYPREKLNPIKGQLSPSVMRQLDQALLTWLALPPCN